MDIKDLFDALKPAKINQSNNYSFGDIVYAKETKCFMIDRYGVITIYVCMFDRQQKPIIY